MGSQAGWELSLSDRRFQKEMDSMLYGLTLLLLLDPSVSQQPQLLSKQPASFFTSYTLAYREAQQQKKPLLVILNPGYDNSTQQGELIPVHFGDVRKTQQRQRLLDRYVVAVIDVTTPHGQAVHQLFEKRSLPHVSVIDRDQQWQVFRTSKKLQGEDWNRILETFQNGDRTASLNLDVQLQCPT